jgi:hypothetical protein
MSIELAEEQTTAEAEGWLFVTSLHLWHWSDWHQSPWLHRPVTAISNVRISKTLAYTTMRSLTVVLRSDPTLHFLVERRFARQVRGLLR